MGKPSSLLARSPHGWRVLVLRCWYSRQRTRGIKMCSAVYANSQTIHQLSTEPAGNESEGDGNKRENKRTTAGDIAVRAPHKPTDDEQHNHQHVAPAVPQPDGLGACVARDGPPINCSRQSR